ncbi:MAG: hypothetical protein HY244_04730 [Rhizobiales bacterium]|nr:hypothetical protein [Hyphomicrobiales bacterium]
MTKPGEMSVDKLVASMDAGVDCGDILDRGGLRAGSHVTRYLPIFESVKTYEGAHDMPALILGRAQTGAEPSAARA